VHKRICALRENVDEIDPWHRQLVLQLDFQQNSHMAIKLLQTKSTPACTHARRYPHKMTRITRLAGLAKAMDNSWQRWDTTHIILLTQLINKISLSFVIFYFNLQVWVGISWYKQIYSHIRYGASFSETVPIDVDSVLRV
jgi:hypothetical protein